MKQNILITLLVACVVLIVVMLLLNWQHDRNRKSKPNVGSDLLAVTRTIEALKAAEKEFGTLPLWVGGETNIINYGVTEETLSQVAILSTNVAVHSLGQRTLIVIAKGSVKRDGMRYGKYAATAAGEVVVVPLERAILGAICTNAIATGIEFPE
jgi:hypothetical protein